MMNIKETMANVLNANSNAKARKEAEKNAKIAACGGIAATAATAVVGFFRVRSMKKKYSEMADTLESVNSRLNVAESKLLIIAGDVVASNQQEPESERTKVLNEIADVISDDEKEENK